MEEYRLTMSSPEYQAAERQLGIAIARSGREGERDALGGPLLQLVRADESSSASPDDADSPQTPGANARLLRPIAEPALAAVLAIVMQDVLSAALVTRLYAPFEGSIARASLRQ